MRKLGITLGLLFVGALIWGVLRLGSDPVEPVGLLAPGPETPDAAAVALLESATSRTEPAAERVSADESPPGVIS